MGSLLYFCDLRGPPKPSLRTPWGFMDPRLRTYVLNRAKLQLENVKIYVCIPQNNNHLDL